MIERVLLPLDGSALSESALAMASEVLTGPRREVELIRVVPSVLQGVVAFSGLCSAPMLGPEWDDGQEEQLLEARTYLESVSRRLPRDVRARMAVRLGDPAGEIVARARYGAFDLIVMSTHGRTGLGRWVMGSVADAVVHHTAVPVLLVHPGEGRGSIDVEPERKAIAASDTSR
jgi:nucleotide-binding universal stress UspA family protein